MLVGQSNHLGDVLLHGNDYNNGVIRGMALEVLVREVGEDGVLRSDDLGLGREERGKLGVEVDVFDGVGWRRGGGDK